MVVLIVAYAAEQRFLTLIFSLIYVLFLLFVVGALLLSLFTSYHSEQAMVHQNFRHHILNFPKNLIKNGVFIK